MPIKNKNLIAILAVTAATASMAHGSSDANSCKSYFKSGFLAGIHGGVAYGSGKFKSNFDTNNPVFGQAAASGRAKKTSALFGVVAGYRQVFSGGYTAGLEVSGDVYTNNKLTKTLSHSSNGVGIDFKNTLNRRYSFIPAVNLGKVFCERWHVAFGLGVAFSNFKHEITNIDGVAGNTAAVSKTKLGIAPSLAVEYAATQNISLVSKLSCEVYKKISKQFGDQLTSPALPGSSYKSSISPRYLIFKVGAVYRF